MNKFFAFLQIELPRIAGMCMGVYGLTHLYYHFTISTSLSPYVGPIKFLIGFLVLLSIYTTVQLHQSWKIFKATGQTIDDLNASLTEETDIAVTAIDLIWWLSVSTYIVYLLCYPLALR